MELSLSEQLMYSTVRIECVLDNGQSSVGTGFFYLFSAMEDGLSVPVIVTNKHVVEGAVSGSFLLTEANKEGKPLDKSHIPVNFSEFEQRWINHPEDDVDLCIMPIAPIFHQLEKMDKRIFYRNVEKPIINTAEKSRELLAVEDIIMIGYPNGLWDSVNNKPVARKGITATHPKHDYEGKEEIVIDAACYGGSSGSPVFILNEGTYTSGSGVIVGSRIIFLGILYAGPQVTVNGEIEIVTIPTSQKRAISKSMVMMNLGFIIKAHKLLDFETIVSEMK